MTTTTKLSTLLLLVSAFACGGSPPQPAKVEAPPPARTLADETDAMCACKDPACADRVHRDFADVDHAAAPKDAPPHVVALQDEVARCEQVARVEELEKQLFTLESEMCACKDAACADHVRHEHDALFKGLPPNLSAVATAAFHHAAECMGDAARASSPAPDGSATLTPADLAKVETGVPECNAFMRTFGEYMACDKLPQAAKDGSMQGAVQMLEGWKSLRDPNVPAEARKAAADACHQASDAVLQSAKALGCALASQPMQQAEPGKPATTKPKAKPRRH